VAGFRIYKHAFVEAKSNLHRCRKERSRKEERKERRKEEQEEDEDDGNVVDNFETAIQRQGKARGVIVAFSFGRGAHEEVARAKNEMNLDIKLMTVEEILKQA
jgi:hypothetical protein